MLARGELVNMELNGAKRQRELHEKDVFYFLVEKSSFHTTAN